MNADRESLTEPEREVRFAVVIYGGVSLAIYINGIVQELLRMVRSTALPVERLKFSERVYRKLACLVGVGETADPHEMDRASRVYCKPAAHPRTKFVADIFSGTSAGGINAIFCAKALATGESLDQLAKLWIEVADIDRLLNDRKSSQKPLELQSPPQSLLNAKWMYLQLLKALTEMDETAPPDAAPIVGDLDVYLTATDLDGLALLLALPHQNVEEKRHRNVFHFMRRDDGRDDFKQQKDFQDSNNPFFAFAARCTSAFPFAFEPMALCDIFPVIQRVDPYRKHAYCKEDTKTWQKFYLDYIGDSQSHGTPFPLRAFGDGGYLDNKPFSYAIDTISDRNADVPVDRKLIYIEPSPETIFEQRRKSAEDRPDAIENSLDALIALPRYETIREDLMRLLDWNKNVARLKRVIRLIDDSLNEDNIDNYRTTAAFKAYQRLRHSSTVDAMTFRVAKAINLDPTSAQAVTLRDMIDSWIPPDSDPAKLAPFLEAYDFDYLTRAVQYLRTFLRAKTSSKQDAQDLAAIKAKIRKCKEDPLTELNLKLNDQQVKDLQSVTDAVTGPQTQPGRRSNVRAMRIASLLESGWAATLDSVHLLLKSHFAGLLNPERLTQLLEKHGGVARFEVRDSIVFPITFGTKLGEFGEVDVLRISPKDVTPLKGLTDTEETAGIRGQAFGAFGAFLDKTWRKHDILRGRLDGAERLITAILPGDDESVRKCREELVLEAQREIALDWEANYEAI